MLRRVEALVVLVPAVADRVALAQAPALLVRARRVGALEVVGEVLLAGEVRAPRRDAAGAVGQRAEDAAAVGIGGGAQQRVSRRRAAHRDRRARRDAASEPARPHDPPGVALALDLDHRDAVRRLRLPHLLGAPRLHAVGVQQAVVGVLVVHHQQPAGVAVAARERVEVDAVVVHPRLHLLLRGGVAGVEAERRAARRHADGLAPGGDRLHRVALRNDDRIGHADRHAPEPERGGGSLRRRAAGERREQGADRRAEAAAEHDAPLGRRHLVEAGVGQAVAVLHRREVPGRARRSRRQSFSVSPAAGCQRISRFSIRPTPQSSASANTVRTRMPAITVLMSKAPSACRIR
jgi:hypothetical protein